MLWVSLLTVMDRGPTTTAPRAFGDGPAFAQLGDLLGNLLSAFGVEGPKVHRVPAALAPAALVARVRGRLLPACVGMVPWAL